VYLSFGPKYELLKKKLTFSELLTLWKSDLMFDKLQQSWIEGINIEYGNIEKCNIDMTLTSKILRRVTSKR